LFFEEVRPMLAPPIRTAQFREIKISARDGVQLNVRHYSVGGSGRRAVVCLPGLTRNGRDFHDLAVTLADPHGHRRDVYTIDLRGRGHSGYASSWEQYSVLSELYDVMDCLTALNLHDTAVVGTSRGGILAMALAVARPGAIGAAILNDIGPVIERDGVVRIAATAGRVPLPVSWDDATRLVRDMTERAFPAIPAEQWAEIARATFNEKDGRPAPAYDPQIARTLSAGGKLPELWPQFSALGRVPVLALRGANSDLLSAETLREMHRRHPRLEAVTIEGQGHAPFLKDMPTITRISEFLIRTDATAHDMF
jgi:pimeloyl-ACP methyl ester carboxylesterase